MARSLTNRLVVAVAVVVLVGTASPPTLAAPADSTEFTVATVNGEPANQTNDVRFFRNDPIVVTLDGLNVSENQFNVTIANRTYSVLPEDDGEIRPRDNPPEPGAYTMTVTHVSRGEELESAQTRINITATKTDDDGGPPEPTPFTVAMLNGEPANQTNDVRFFRDDPIVIELDGLNVSENRFNVTIANRTYSVLPEDDGAIRPRDDPPERGAYTMTVTHVYRGEELNSTTTRINITDVKTEPTRPEPTEFTVATVNGESATQTNEVRFFRDDPIVMTLDGLNVSENQFDVTIANRTYPVFPEDDGAIRPRDNPPEPGEYTMTVTHVFRGQVLNSTTTRINITDVRTADGGPLEPTEFTVARVNGASANQTNDVRFLRDEPLVIELDGLNVSANRFNVTIGDRTYPLFPDDEGAIRPRDDPPAPGEYTLTVTQIDRGRELASAQTRINITEVASARGPSEPTAFEIATVGGEPANRTNDVRFLAEDPIVFELAGVNVSEFRFNVTIGDRTYPVFPDDEGAIRPHDEPPETGEYTMNVTLLYRGEPFHSDQTRINITETADTSAFPSVTTLSIVAVDGQPTDEAIETVFTTSDPLRIELSGTNLSELPFNVTIGNKTYPLVPANGSTIRLSSNPPEPGAYTVTVTQVYRGEELATATTSVEIITPNPNESTATPTDGAAGDATATPSESGPGFGVLAALLGVAGTFALLGYRRRSGH